MGSEEVIEMQYATRFDAILILILIVIPLVVFTYISDKEKNKKEH
jgi:hypothetical protein